MKIKNTKQAILLSALALLVCFAMLIGSTYAWFTDTATTGVNTIQAGTLKIALESSTDGGQTWANAEGQTLSFLNVDGESDILWEPGCTYNLPLIRVRNDGNLALKYELYINGVSGNAGLLSAIDFTANGTAISTFSGVLNEEDAASAPIQIAGHMKESAGNEYQGLTLNGITITVVATQQTFEKDSIDDQYDATAELPVVTVVSNTDDLKEALANGENVVLTDDIELPSTLLTKKDVVIDLNGNSITAPSSGNMFQSSSDYDPDIIITSATDGAEINISGGDTSVLLGYGSTTIENVTINVEDGDKSSPNPFKVYGDLTLGEGTVVNIDYLGTSLISNNAANAIVIDGAKINIGTFKTNATAMIALNNASTLEMKNTEIKIDNFYISTFGNYFISKVDGVTIDGCTFDVTGSDSVDYTFVAKDGKYRLVQK